MLYKKRPACEGRSFVLSEGELYHCPSSPQPDYCVGLLATGFRYTRRRHLERVAVIRKEPLACIGWVFVTA